MNGIAAGMRKTHVSTILLSIPYFCYTLLFAVVPYWVVDFNSDMAEKELKRSAILANILRPGWWTIWLLCFFVLPVYLIIYDRVCHRFRGWDFVFLFSPFLTWLLLSLINGSKSGFNYLYVEPAMMLILSGAYFFEVPISRRFPGIPRVKIGLWLFLGMLTCAVLIARFVPEIL